VTPSKKPELNARVVALVRKREKKCYVSSSLAGKCKIKWAFKIFTLRRKRKKIKTNQIQLTNNIHWNGINFSGW